MSKRDLTHYSCDGCGETREDNNHLVLSMAIELNLSPQIANRDDKHLERDYCLRCSEKILEIIREGSLKPDDARES